MKMLLKTNERALRTEKYSADKIRRDYEYWQEQTLRRAREAADLRQLRDLFYQLGDRWEWQQTTGTWLSKGTSLESVGLVIRAPGLLPARERYILYIIMAYSKGAIGKFDHLGDKERVIIERDMATGHLRVWSTAGHGALDLWTRDLTPLGSVERVLREAYLVTQPGDHALRLEIPSLDRTHNSILQHLWRIAMGLHSFSTREVEVLDAKSVEESLGFRFYEYTEAVITLERMWSQVNRMNARSRDGQSSNDMTESELSGLKRMLRIVEGLLYILWFRPPALQIGVLRKAYRILNSDPIMRDRQSELLMQIQRVIKSLNDVLERSKYLKWKSVMERESLDTSEGFEDLTVSQFAKEALATAFEDILREHTLAYIGYPERATIRGKCTRVVFGLGVLPIRLLTRFIGDVLVFLARIWPSRLRTRQGGLSEGQDRI